MKRLSDGTVAQVGMYAEVINNFGGHKKGKVVEITQTEDMYINKAGLLVDLDRWVNVVACGEFIQHINSLKLYKL